MLESIRLQNFRSHRDFFAKFQPGPIVITGDNGAGKTTILEAIYLALAGKSYRSNFREITTKGQDWWRADLVFTDEARTIRFQGGAKEFLIGGKSTKVLPKKSRVPVLLFEPNDLMIIYGSPARRREFFDRFIAQIDPTFSAKIAKFDRILRQRNNLLKSGQASAENLFIWDLQFANLSAEISKQRAAIAGQINERINKYYDAIAGIDFAESPDRHLKINFLGSQKSAREILNQIQVDFRRGFSTTKIGAQRDDYEFAFARQNVKTGASRGESRTLLFAILASFAEMINETLHRQVYILLDDVDGELDQIHRQNLYQVPIFLSNHLVATTISFTGQIANNIKL